MSEIEGLTNEEITVLKEVAQDRMAVSRVVRRLKNIALTVTAVVAAYLLVADTFISWVRTKLGF